MKRTVLSIFLAGTAGLASQGAFAVDFQAVSGDGTCPSGTVMVTADVAYNYKPWVCKAIGDNASARLAGGGAMSSAATGCAIKANYPAPQPATLCDSMPFQVASGDNTCPAGSRLATVQEAVLFNSQACAALSGNKWYIARLAGGGSIGGSGYNCVVNGDDPTALGNSLCTTAPVMSK